MFKKSLLLMLFLALLAPWATAQNTHLVCNGTQTNSAVPIRNGNGTQTEFVYPASMLSDMDGGTITSVKFFYSTSTATYSSTATVYVEEVSTTTMSSSAWCYNQNTATVVYQGTTLALADSVMTITFNTPYVYNGGNLCFNIWYSGSAPSVTSYGVSTDNYTSGYDWAITPPVSKPYSRAKYLPKAEFTYTPATGTCKKPTILEPTDVTASTATLRWTEKGSADSWILQYGTDSEFGAGTYTEATSGFNTEASPTIVKAVEGLLDLTKYYVRVKSVCTPGTDESDWSNTINFTTKQNPVVVGDGWSDDFEGSSCGWQLINGTITQANWYWGAAEHNGEGSHSVYITNDNGSTCSYNVSGAVRVYATKLLTFANSKYTFQFDWKCKGETTSYDFLSVGLLPANTVISADDTDSGTLPTGWISLHDATYLNGVTTWQTSPEKTVQLEAGNYYLVLRWRQDGSGPNSSPFPAAVDNVSITRVACDYDVTGLEVEDDPAPTAHTATINWTAGEATQWQVAWSKDNSFPAANTQTEIVSSATKELTELEASSTYFVKVRAYCGGTDYGQWCNAINFDTECEIITSFPWDNNFDSYTGVTSGTTNNLPGCWNYINTSTYSSYKGYPVIYNSSYNAHSGTNYLYFYSYYSTSYDYDPQDEYAILPEMSDANSKMLTFYAKRNYSEISLKVGLMTDPKDASTFNGVQDIALTTSYAKYSVTLTGNGNYIALMMEKANGTVTGPVIYVDDIAVMAAPDCATPTGLAVTANSQTPEGATITWTAGDATSWIVEYKKSTEENYTALAEPVTSPTHTFLGLDAATQYNARVSVVCTTGSGVTYPTDPVNFTTKVQYPAPTNLQTSNVTDQSATLSWTPGYQETTWTVKYKASTVTSWDDPSVVTETVITNPTINISGLTGATTYNVQVINCENALSGDFTTAFGVPFSEDFQTSQTNAPSGWARYLGLLSEVMAGTTQLSSLSSNHYWLFNNEHVFGQYHARVNIFGTTCKHWLVTPNIVITANQSLSFDLALTKYGNSSAIVFPEGQADDKFVVLISTNNGATWNILRQWDNAGSEYVYNEISPAGEIVFIDLASYSGETVLIAFYGESTVGKTGEDNDLHIDNVSIDNTPTCYRPSGVTDSNVTNHSATISWTPGEAGQTAWQIAYYKGANFIPAEVNLDTIPTLMVQDNPTYTFDKTLDADSHYYFYVRANCGTAAEPEYSAWSKKVCAIATAAAAPAPTAFNKKADVYPDWVDLYWTAPAGDFLSGYGIYYQNASTPEPTSETAAIVTIEGATAPTSESPYRLEGLTGGTTYYLWIRANHEENVYSSWTKLVYPYYVTTPEACPKPTSLVASEPSPNSIKLNWTPGAEWQTSWVIAYSKTEGFDPTDSDACTYVDANENPFVVTGLDSDETYYFRVKGDCDTYGESEWNTTEASETTLVSCPAPTDIVASNLTQNTADLTWTGYSDNYTLQYRTAGGYDVDYTEDFSGLEPASYSTSTYYLPEGWKSYNSSTSGYNPRVSSYSNYTYISMDGNYLLLTFNENGQYAYAIMPRYSNLTSMSFKYKYENSDKGTLTVGYVTNNTGFDTYQELQTPDKTTTVTNYSLTTESIATINAANGFVAFRLEGNGTTYYSVSIDDIAIVAGENHEVGEWMYSYPTTEFVSLEDLLAGRKYEVQIQGECSGTPSEPSDTYTFTTLAEGNKVFTTEGNWDVAANWAPTGVPSITDNAIIRANATIPSGCVAEANNITVEGTPAPTITMLDGGQLMHNNTGVTLTVHKSITGYGEGNGNWYLLSAPSSPDVDPDDVENMLTGEYDLYSFDYTKVGEEWRNHKQGAFNLASGSGYLYANKADKDLVFTNEIDPIGGIVYYIGITNTDAGTQPFNGLHLIGNFYPCNTYLTIDNEASVFYKMKGDGTEIVPAASGTPIAPCEGIFVLATSSTEQKARFVKELPVASVQNNSNLVINVNNSTIRGEAIDNAIVNFGEGNNLVKFQLNPNHTKVYIPQDGKDYAVVSAESYGELPVSFKAAENGNYTLSFTTDNVEFSYLHLIDHMTGNDVDLLQTPSYNFDAQYTDIAARFKLVFAKSNADMGDDFGFIDASGNLLVLGIDGTATLQVIDVTGRVLSSETFSGNYSKPVKAAAGVYMIRLIQGNDSRTQKIVVK